MKRSIGLAAVALLASCSTAVSTGTEPQPQPRPRQGSWEHLPRSPLSARYGAHSLELDGKLYVIGGGSADPCPPGADCTTPSKAPFSDGAVYDPSTGTWSEIADAPVPVGYATSAVVGDEGFFLVGDFTSTHSSVRPAFLSYDPQHDRWQEHALPPKDRWRVLASSGTRVVAFQASQENGIEGDFVFDPASDRWSELPPDPLRPSYDRWMVGTDAGLVLTAISSEPREPDEPNLYAAAVLADGRWQRFGESQIFGYNPEWSWTAGKVLNPSNERADGGEMNNWGRTYNAGGTLDPDTGEWGPLSDPPRDRGDFEGLSAAGERYAIAYSGWVYDAVDEEWLHLTRPENGPDGETSATWVGDELFVYGGVNWQGNDGVILDDGWVWRRFDATV